MRSLVRCQYCGYMVGDTRDHVIPKSILHLYPRSPMYVVVKACRKCNETKRDSLYLPTLSNIHDVYKNMDFEYVYYLARWVVSNNLRVGLYYPNLKAEVNEIVKLWLAGYYEYMRKLWRDNDRYTGGKIIE